MTARGCEKVRTGAGAGPDPDLIAKGTGFFAAGASSGAPGSRDMARPVSADALAVRNSAEREWNDCPISAAGGDLRRAGGP